MTTPIETAALRWHRARKALQKAKNDLKAYREKHGGCEVEGADNGDREPKGICYHDDKDQNTWCDTCLGSEPLFQAKRKAGQEQGAAMRQLMRLCGQETVQIEMEEQHA
jgi:hypothetical protein